MTLLACAEIVRRGDPDRFLSAMAAPAEARKVLFPLYAFNVEVARAPWVTNEPMIAEMRLQWWRDALAEIAAGGVIRSHEVVTELAHILPPELALQLDSLIAARRWDVYNEPFEDDAHFAEYIDATSGHLMWTAAKLLGGGDESTVRSFAHGAGVASFLRAVPALVAGGRQPLPEPSLAEARRMAGAGLARLDDARQAHRSVARGADAAMLAGWRAAPTLTKASQDPQKVLDGTLDESEFRRRARLIRLSMTGWWR